MQNIIKASIDLKQLIFNDLSLQHRLEEAIGLCVASLKNGGKVLFCGNGGSAADAQHRLPNFQEGTITTDRLCMPKLCTLTPAI